MNRKPKVLIAEDDEQIRNLLKTSLNTQGYEVSLACDGQEATNIFSQVKPDALVMDLNMPRMDGIEAIKRIRQMPLGQDIPILVLTALDTEKWETESRQAGCDLFMTKPFRPKDLIHCMRTLFANYETQPDKSVTSVPPGVNVKVAFQTAEGFIHCYLKNLMGHRSFLATEKVLPLGSTFRFEITPPGGGNPFTVRGTVRWVNLYSDQKGMGVEFAFEDPAEQERIHHWVMSTATQN